LDEEDTTVIRRSPNLPARALAVAAITLAAFAAAGCEQGNPADEVVTRTAHMTEEDYVAHIAALTIAVDEGLTGGDADARAIELGSAGHSREDVEEFAALLRTRPERWLDIEGEVDSRVADLRRELAAEGEHTPGE
jgi:hypothetical protein